MRIKLDPLEPADTDEAKAVRGLTGPPDPLIVPYVCQRCGAPLPETLTRGQKTIGLVCEKCGTWHQPTVV